MFDNIDVFEENIKVINEIKEYCLSFKQMINNLENIDTKNFLKDIECIEALISELDNYNILLTESRTNTLKDINIWDSIKSCVKASNLNHNKTNRPNVIVEVIDNITVPATKTTFNVENNRNNEHGINNFKINHCLPIMQLAPMLLIDNAFKYCNPGGQINIIIEKDETMTTFSFNNLGPKINEEERDRIWESNYRGENTQRTNIEGQGLGLYLFNIIINLHSHLAAEKSIKIDDTVHIINGIEYSLFTISFSILNEPLDTNKSKDINTLYNRLQDFTTHQYIRIIPRICKISKSLFNQLYKNTNILGNEICEKAYDIKNAITAHFIYLQSINDEFCEFSENAQSSQVRLDNSIIHELEYVKSFNNDFKHKIIRSGTYRGKPTTSPYIDIFVHDFIAWLLLDSNINEVDINIYKNEIEIVSEKPYKIDNESIENWKRILRIDDIQFQIQREKGIITIS